MNAAIRKLWESKLIDRGVKAWCDRIDSPENNDPIQEAVLNLIDRKYELKIGDKIAIGSPDNGCRIVCISKIFLKESNPVRWFAIESVASGSAMTRRPRRASRCNQHLSAYQHSVQSVGI